MLIEAQEVIAILESEAGDTVPSMYDRETRALRKTLARMKLSLAKLGCLLDSSRRKTPTENLAMGHV